ncbi:MAG: DNA gyrase subunit A [Acidobacteria bacterium]|nr:DNA gyrase subunit A [Acidobacteriota bacterium]
MPQSLGQELPVNIEEELKRSYLDYAMSVIIGRALPDIRDGLKPVHRRVLYAMNELGNNSNRPYKKSARIVGDVIGKYHPHGESAVYDAIVRMVQDFSLRIPLIDGQGNFGSIDGDSPAAMRYTEIRLEGIAEELLADIDKETVDFIPTYDESLIEPVVLPARFPNLIVNGASGIAVGMATNIPPHNLGEIINATVLLLDRPDASIAELMELVPGPDFPTGAFIYGRGGIRQANETGRGILQLRARASIEKAGKEREAIVIHEIPYQVNKARLIEKMAELVREKEIEGIQDLRDESDREGMRIVVELKKGEAPEIILNQLYKLTPMQTSFGVIFLAIVNGQPQVLNLGQILSLFLDHRREIVTRRTQFELRKAEARAHILEGLRQALDHIDQIIALIRAAKAPAEAKQNLILNFSFTVVQAEAILEMRLQRLTGLERQKIDDEYNELLKKIAEYKEILSSERALKNVIRNELLEIQQNYESPRRTVIVDEEIELTMEDLIADEQVVITATHRGYIKRTALHIYKSQRRGGKGRIGMSTKTEEDVIDYLFIASTHSYILIFTDRGRVYWLKVYEIPDVGAAGKGKAIVNLVNLEKGEKIADMISAQDFSQSGYVVMASRQGYIKKTELSAFSNPRSTGIIACSVDEKDELIAVEQTSGRDQILLSTRNGKAIRFAETDVRDMGRQARGVRGIALRPGDQVVGMDIIRDDSGAILAVTENGYGKRTPVTEYRLQGRGGQGVINMKTTARNGQVVTVCYVQDDSEVIIITERGKIIRLEASRIRQTMSRSAQGVKLIDLEEGDRVADLTLVPREEEQMQDETEA